ncbi:hypothetical protein [Streptomyces sp. NPDC059349]|uniref:hypothetical protein n=1 Tax=Streptomyces sp. NPDC059349 TaxID=3346808 RepID=UPI0036AA1FBE
MDNTPWFVRGVASDDIIRAEIDNDGVRWAGGDGSGLAELHDAADLSFTASVRLARASSSSGWVLWMFRWMRICG